MGPPRDRENASAFLSRLRERDREWVRERVRDLERRVLRRGEFERFREREGLRLRLRRCDDSSLATTSKGTNKQSEGAYITVTAVSSVRFPVVISTISTAASPVAVPVAIPVTVPFPSIAVIVPVPVTLPVALIVHVVLVLHVDVHFLFFRQHATNEDRQRKWADCVGPGKTPMYHEALGCGEIGVSNLQCDLSLKISAPHSSWGDDHERALRTEKIL